MEKEILDRIGDIVDYSFEICLAYIDISEDIHEAKTLIEQGREKTRYRVKQLMEVQNDK